MAEAMISKHSKDIGELKNGIEYLMTKFEDALSETEKVELRKQITKAEKCIIVKNISSESINIKERIKSLQVDGFVESESGMQQKGRNPAFVMKFTDTTHRNGFLFQKKSISGLLFERAMPLVYRDEFWKMSQLRRTKKTGSMIKGSENVRAFIDFEDKRDAEVSIHPIDNIKFKHRSILVDRIKKN